MRFTGLDDLNAKSVREILDEIESGRPDAKGSEEHRCRQGAEGGELRRDVHGLTSYPASSIAAFTSASVSFDSAARMCSAYSPMPYHCESSA